MSSISLPASHRSADAPVVSIAISGMSCGHCVAAVRSALGEVPGVHAAQVAVGAARVAIDPAAGPANAIVRAAITAIEDAGYGARVTDDTPADSRADACSR